MGPNVNFDINSVSQKDPTTTFLTHTITLVHWRLSTVSFTALGKRAKRDIAVALLMIVKM